MDYVIVCERTGQTIAQRARLANRPWSRMLGLLGRRGLAPGEAIILRPAFSIHTMFMRFALDVIFLSRGGDVVKIARDVRPFRMVSGRGAHDTIEMQAGALDADLNVGDRLIMSRREG